MGRVLLLILFAVSVAWLILLGIALPIVVMGPDVPDTVRTQNAIRIGLYALPAMATLVLSLRRLWLRRPSRGFDITPPHNP
jgi:purine-cytosine permease-like protein